MTNKTISPFGTWASPIGAQSIAAGSKSLSAVRVQGTQIYWLEGLAAQGGRVAILRAGGDSGATALTDTAMNVRSRVHEYGGGAYLVAGNDLYFSNFADNLVYVQCPGESARAVTRDSQVRHADFDIDVARHRLIAVQEDHRAAGVEATNRLVSIDLAEGGDCTTLAEGFDFYSTPRLSPDGKHLAWLAWNHPLMPWNGCELWLADVANDGSLNNIKKLAGGADESLCQPTWSPDGQLYVVSDRSGWWNIHRISAGALQPICPMQAEFGRPQWVFGQAMFGFCDKHLLIAAFIENGLSHLARIDLRDGSFQRVHTDFTEVHDIAVGADFVVVLASSPMRPMQVIRIDLASKQNVTLAQSTNTVPSVDFLSAPQAVSFESSNGASAHAFFYPPANAHFLAPVDEKPPLIVTSHGGPTSMAGNGLRLGLQYWTSRGFAVLDVNYRGSSGFGRDYMGQLQTQWGIADVADCVAGAQYLAKLGLVDGDRMAIRGGSASGFTTLCALTFYKVFKAGASHYGVSDLAALDADTHKFESRYTTQLVAGPQTRDEVYRQRSPLLHADKITCPMIFFQGQDDKVVPPAQSEAMVAALKSRHIPVAYVPFEGEGHGFRRAENIQRALEAELYFYGRVFGFTPSDVIEPVDIQNLN